MLDLNNAREIFADYLQENAGHRHSLDAALMAACEWSYRAGLRDGTQETRDCTSQQRAGWSAHGARAPTLEDDSFVDKAIATVGYVLWDRHDGGITNAVQLLLRPLDVRGDEAGGHPGESFVMATLTREEIREILAVLDEDWANQLQCTGEPNA